jgi:hypothetical protein
MDDWSGVIDQIPPSSIAAGVLAVVVFGLVAAVVILALLFSTGVLSI